MARLSFLLLLSVATSIHISVVAFEPYRLEDYVDTTVDPCADFYNFTCGTFIKTAKAANTNNTVTFDVNLQRRFINITEEILTTTKVSSEHPRAVNMAIRAYEACLEKNYKPTSVKTLFKEIGGWPLMEGRSWEHRSWVKVEALATGNLGLNALIGFLVTPDPRNSAEYVIGLLMPEVKIPILTNGTDVKKSLFDIATCLGNDDHEQIQEDTVRLISFMRKLEKAKIDRDPMENFNYNKVTVGELQKRFSNVDWLRYIRTVLSTYNVATSKRITSSTEVLLQNSEYFDKLKTLMAGIKDIARTQKEMDRTVANYIGWNLAMEYQVSCPEEVGNGKDNTATNEIDRTENEIDRAENEDRKWNDVMNNLWDMIDPLWSALSESEEDSIEQNEINREDNEANDEENTITGAASDDVEGETPEDKSTEETTSPRNSQLEEQYCGVYIQQSMNFALEYVFLQKYGFNITRVSQMIKYIQSAFSTLLRRSSWIKNSTIRALLIKMRSMKLFTAFPPWLLSAKELDDYYKEMADMTSDFMLNSMNIGKFLSLKMLSQLDTKPSVFKWMPNQSLRQVNAYHYLQRNALVLPFAILKSPYFDDDRPMYVNFGIVGSIIGHELTHAFDSQGRFFDPQGHLNKTWLSGEFETKFISRTQCFVQQYSNYTVEGYQVNGEQTLPDNIADCGGIRQSYLAYQNWANDQGEEPPLPGFENFTPEQLFFMTYGTSWCASFGDDGYLSSVVQTDGHSPQPARVWGAVSNTIEFAEAFGCPKGSPMNPEHKCILW